MVHVIHNTSHASQPEDMTQPILRGSDPIPFPEGGENVVELILNHINI